MARFILLLLSLVVYSETFAQIDAVTERLRDRKYLNDLYTGKTDYSFRSSLPDNMEISFEPYLFSNERPAVIYTIQGDTITGNFKYNIASEALESDSRGERYAWNSVVAFSFQQYNGQEAISFTNQKLFAPKGIEGGFLEDANTSADVKRKYYFVFEPGSDLSTPYSDTNTEDRVVLESEILIRLGDDEVIRMPDSKRGFYDLFPEKGDELKKYAKKNKLKVDDLKDIGKMIAWVKSGN